MRFSRNFGQYSVGDVTCFKNSQGENAAIAVYNRSFDLRLRLAMRRPRLLIVDDEESVTRTLQLVFEELGYTVDTALNSVDAITALANGHKYDAVITDLNMEREDIGLDVAKAAKQVRPAPIVVICTGYASPVNTRSALQIHVDYFANKPVDLEELISNLDRLLARRGELQ